jgi:hypothetical protein
VQGCGDLTGVGSQRFTVSLDQEQRAISMIDAEGKTSSGPASRPGEPRRSRLRQILDERPEARPRLGRAIAVLLGTELIAFAAVGGLLIWHIIRRGRLIRERLSAPRVVRLPEIPTQETDPQS